MHVPRLMTDSVPASPGQAADRTAAHAARWSDVGGHRLARVFIAGNLSAVVLAETLSRVQGPPILWAGDVPRLLALSVLLCLWATHAFTPGRLREWAIPDTLAAMLCVSLAGFWLSPSQYLVASGLDRPLIDPWLARADAALGVHVPSLATWTAARPTLTTVLAIGYTSLLFQFFFVGPFVGLYARQRRHLWEYVWHFHVCAAITLSTWALFPAASAFQYYGFEPALDQTRFIEQFQALRAGTLPSVDMSQLEGMISMPSFHVLGAMMVTWAVRTSRAALFVLVPLNVLLTASTVLAGLHYAVDVAGAAVVFAVSLASWRLLGSRVAPPAHGE